MKKILILDGHPDDKSFCAAAVDKYYDGAKSAGLSVDMLKIRDLKFDPILHFGYRQRQELEKDLLMAQEKIKECNHLVFVVPVWWGGLPALTKGFFDRVFMSGFSHKFNPAKKIQEKLLTGRSVSVIYTQGGPWWYSKFFIGDAFWKSVKRAIFGFAGFSPVKRKYYDTVKSGDDAERTRILNDVYKLGTKGF
jgi:putative NADPH-quinone reductase